MTETQFSYMKTSTIISIKKTPERLKNKFNFTPLETSNDTYDNNIKETIQFSESQKKKSSSAKLEQKILKFDIVNNSKMKLYSKFNTQIHDDINSLIELKEELSFYNSNRNSSGVICEKKEERGYKLIPNNINEHINNRKLTCINNECLFTHKNINENKLNNNNKEQIKKHIPQKSISSNLQFNQDEVTSLSNIQDISNFYLYTENCFEMMYDLEKVNKINKCTPLSFPFDEIIKEKKKKLAIFDLDETLVHCQVKNIEECQYQININLPSKKKIGKIGVNIRPNWKRALNKIKDKYIIVIFTASHQTYADAILDFLDPNKLYFPYRLYRNNCTSIKLQGKDIYIKDLSLFKNISLKDIIVIDNSVISFFFQLNNGIPILPYYNSINDNELICLSYYLSSIYSYDDLREANKINFQLQSFKDNVFEKIKLEEIESGDENENAQISNIDSSKFSNKTMIKIKVISDDIKESINSFRKKIFESNNNIHNLIIDFN